MSEIAKSGFTGITFLLGFEFQTYPHFWGPISCHYTVSNTMYSMQIVYGGSLWSCMATQCQTDTRSGGGELQNLGAVNSFEGKKGGGQLQTESPIRVVTCKMHLLSLYYTQYSLYRKLQKRGQSKKTEGRTGPKSMGGSLAVGTYLERSRGSVWVDYSLVLI